MSFYPTVTQLRAIAGSRAKVTIAEHVAEALPRLAPLFGLDRPERLAHFIAQLAHESAGFSTTREFASGKAYEGRKDLGNTRPGDGVRFKGHGLIQTTGRANHREFTGWAQERFKEAPDFEKEPEKLTEFPWALLSALYYWDSRKLNALADKNNIEMITKRINGGRNGLADRITLYERTALNLLGFGTDETGVKAFQAKAGIEVDGDTGPATRRALHEALTRLEIDESPIPEAVKPRPKPEVVPAPAPPAAVKSRKGGFIAVVGLVLALAAAGLAFAFLGS